jgi:hypothetical protein
MHRDQAAGLLGVANNPQCSQDSKHFARKILIAAGNERGISKNRMAGFVGSTTNPSLTLMQRREARLYVLKMITNSNRASSPEASCSESQMSDETY